MSEKVLRPKKSKIFRIFFFIFKVSGKKCDQIISWLWNRISLMHKVNKIKHGDFWFLEMLQLRLLYNMRLNKCYTVEASQCIAMLTQKFTSKSEATPIHPTVEITEFKPATTPAQLCGQNLLKCEQGEKLFKIPNLTSDDMI